MKHRQIVQAIYRNGMLELLQPVNCREGAQVWVEINVPQRGKNRRRAPLLSIPHHPDIASLRGAAGSLKKPLSWQEVQDIAREDHLQDESANNQA